MEKYVATYNLFNLENSNLEYLKEFDGNNNLSFENYLEYLNDKNSSVFDNRLWNNLHALSLGASEVILSNEYDQFKIKPIFPLSFYFHLSTAIKNFFLLKYDGNMKYYHYTISADKLYLNSDYDYEISIIFNDYKQYDIFSYGRIFIFDNDRIITFNLKGFIPIVNESFKQCYLETINKYYFFKDFQINEDIKNKIEEIELIEIMIFGDKYK